MSAKLVKYCPLCGAANDPAEPFCAACRDGELLGILPEPLHGADALVTAGERQDALAARAACWEGEDAPSGQAGAAPGPDTRHVENEAGSEALVLELIEQPALRFRIVDGQSAGSSRDSARAADVALAGVPHLDYISSVHARFFRRGAQWYVQHTGGTNFIKVDGARYDKREEVPLHDGSVLVLSKTPFRVLIGGAG